MRVDPIAQPLEVLKIRRNDAFNTVTSVFYFVFLFASSVFYPLDPLPRIFRIVGHTRSYASSQSSGGVLRRPIAPRKFLRHRHTALGKVEEDMRAFALSSIVHPGLFILTLLVSAGSAIAQGSLTPPAGTPAPTMKTLDQVEARTVISSLPFTISNSGSYYLAKNLSALPDQGGIVINASDVTLDLNGFGLFGALGAAGSHGVTLANLLRNVTVRNGTLNNWKGRAISAGAATADCRFLDLRIRDAAAEGLVGGFGATVERCNVISSGAAGIVVSARAMVKDCASSENLGTGITTGDRSVVTNCLADGNTGNGIIVTSGCRVIGNHCTNNTHPDSGLGYGIAANGKRTYVDGNTCIDNETGILAVQGGLVVRNMASGNTDQAFQFGVALTTVYGETIQQDTGPINETVSAWANFDIIDL